MAYTVAGTVTIGGAPAPNGASVQVWAMTGTVELVATTTVSGGAGAFSATVPNNTRDYRALYDDGTNLGISELMAPNGTADPVAAFSSSGSTLTITFTDASIDPDGAIVSWAWTFGDSGTSSSQNPQHTYAGAGTYTVTLTVTDDLGATGFVSHDISVSASTPPSYVAAGTATPASSVQSVTPPWPAGVQVGDIGIMVLSALGSNNYTLTDAQGFVEAPDSPQHLAGDDLNARLQVWWCRATSTTPSAPTIGDVVDDAKIGIIFTVRGCVASGNPFDVTAGDAAAASTSIAVPGDTTTVAQCLIAAVVAHRVDSNSAQITGWANAGLSSVTERIDECTALGDGYGIGVATGVKATGGTFGNTTATLGVSKTQARWMGALKPA